MELEDPELELGMTRAYHRYLYAFCGHSPDKFKGMIVAPARRVKDAVSEIQRWGTSNWTAGVMLLLGENQPVDHPDLEPI